MHPLRLEALRQMAPADKKARLYMLGDFIKGTNKVIVDPYNVSRSNRFDVGKSFLNMFFCRRSRRT